MSATRIGITLTGTVATLSILLAGSTIWLVLTNPATVVSALDEKNVAPAAHALAAALVTALRGLLSYL